MRLELREIVKQMVEDALDEGSRRDDYINRLVDSIEGAFSEYAKARYAEINATSRQKAGPGTVQGWDREASERIVFDVVPAMRRRLKVGDKKRAFDEAVDEFRDLAPLYLRAAKHKVATSFKVDEGTLVDPPDAVTDEFFAKLENMFEELTQS